VEFEELRANKVYEKTEGGKGVEDPVITEQASAEIEQQTGEKKLIARKPLKILIVEDDFVTRHLEASLLSEFGICEIVVDGKEAVSSFESRMIENDPYNLIILDIMVPFMDGHEVLNRAVKEDN